ncbi:MAG: ABC transporter ATP-binding protein [Magnetococcales bacterium]|nr:ABC transporter ATP-binding protein [Magnetococcales bacterium]
MTALCWREISLRKSGRLILAGVSLAVARGELLGIVGPNGAGKTALLRCAAGLERGATGVVELAGVPLTRLAPHQRAQGMAFLPQQAETAWPITVSAAVALGRLPHAGRCPEADRRAVAWALDAVGMTSWAERPITTLSGGERALVMLARVLAVEAPVLLLDEPSAALDPQHQLATMELLCRLAQAGLAVCIVLHDLALAARFCQRIVLLQAGRVVADGTPEATLTDDHLQQVYAIRGIRHPIDGAHRLVAWERLPPSSGQAAAG